jgi:hypothetical protein
MKRCDGTKYNDVAERFASASSVAMACKREKINVFLLLCVFVFLFYSFFFFLSIVATRAIHYMTINSKTHRSAQPRCEP